MLIIIPFIIFLIMLAIQYYLISAAVANGTFQAMKRASNSGLKTL